MPWYAITVHAGQELRVKAEVERRAAHLVGGAIQEVAVPTNQSTESRNGQPVRRELRTLPGYVLLKARLTDSVWSLLRATPGVAGIVGAANQAVEVPALEVEQLLNPQSVTRKPRVPFALGDAVEVVEGPLVGLSGTVSEINQDAATLKVLVPLFDRDISAQVSFDQVKAG